VFSGNATIETLSETNPPSGTLKKGGERKENLFGRKKKKGPPTESSPGFTWRSQKGRRRLVCYKIEHAVPNGKRGGVVSLRGSKKGP